MSLFVSATSRTLLSVSAAARSPPASNPCVPAMYSASGSEANSRFRALHQVPELGAGQIEGIAEETFRNNAALGMKRSGAGVAVAWFRNDLRILDNEVLVRAWMSSEAVLPVYCVDPRLFATTHYFGFPKTGAFRAKFLIESLADLKKNLMKRGLNLLVRHGKPEDVLPSIAKAIGAHTVYAHKETCSEELIVEQQVSRALQRIVVHCSNQNTKNPKLHLVWGSTMYHLDDLPFSAGSLPDVYTQFRKSVESKCTVRGCYKLPTSLGPLPSVSSEEVGGWGHVPSLNELGVCDQKAERCFGDERDALDFYLHGDRCEESGKSNTTKTRVVVVTWSLFTSMST
ncbi:Myosin-3 [Asimina triloba]